MSAASALVKGMTDDEPTTPATSRHEAYINGMRAIARREGRAIPRLTMPTILTGHGPFTSGSFLFVQRAKGGMRAVNLGTGEVAKANPETIQDWLFPVTEQEVGVAFSRPSGAPHLVVADRSVAIGLAAAAQRSGARRLAVTLAMTESLPSAFVTVLSEALSRKFYTPSGTDEQSLPEWAKALHIEGKGVAAILAMLRACAGNGDLDSSVISSLNGDLTMIVMDEERTVPYLGLESLASASIRYETMVKHHTILAYLAACDPIGRDQARLDGTVFDITYVGEGDPAAEGPSRRYAVRSPFKVRDSDRLVRCDAGETEDGWTVMSVRAAGGDLYHLDLLGPRIQKATVTPAPYRGGGRARAGIRWSLPADHESAPQRVVREVPLVVSLMGAPTAGE